MQGSDFDSYKIGNTYSMLVFGLDEIDFEYAYSFDGPYEPEKGIIFDKRNTFLTHTQRL